MVHSVLDGPTWPDGPDVVEDYRGFQGCLLKDDQVRLPVQEEPEEVEPVVAVGVPAVRVPDDHPQALAAGRGGWPVVGDGQPPG